jgi:hypothetical protein
VRSVIPVLSRNCVGALKGLQNREFQLPDPLTGSQGAISARNSSNAVTGSDCTIKRNWSG